MKYKYSRKKILEYIQKNRVFPGGKLHNKEVDKLVDLLLEKNERKR